MSSDSSRPNGKPARGRTRRVLAAAGLTCAVILAGLALLLNGRPTSQDQPPRVQTCGKPKYVGQRCTEVTENAIATFTRELTAQVSPVTKTNLMFAAQSNVEVIKAKKPNPSIAVLCRIAYLASPDYEFMVPNSFEDTKKSLCDPALRAKKNGSAQECFKDLVDLFHFSQALPKELPDFTHGVLGKACGLSVDKSLKNQHVGA